MFGQNPKRSILSGDGTSLEVQSIFKTIQGEGIFVGCPAIFIRLGGCNLACNFCDTEFEDFELVDIAEILNKVESLALNSKNEKSINLVVITGGEPMRQPIELLCQKLLDQNLKVQIETNGTLYRSLPKGVSIICSPKAGKTGYSKIREDLLPKISAVKFIVAKNIAEYSIIPEVGQTCYNIPVFIQPMDQNDQRLNDENNELAVKLALESGARLSLQTHKFLGIE
ncbi:7-carboxy-7-deazaguanine synthase QueE [Rickettsia hoogstraalii]|uniref:7-carboxy-7-deazaguanine synthase QueE n=1 Tax=Rickettsia hoogstraalii TaxID=467174 RepID=UPI0022584C85|nr:7-carboxy-7-deazaguanine synthase QueE [Rickettsia hoogstraalii]MCX4084085.1 7-carboxy-7-deazaguanine synthase QueE [Rickettsia hoogstraalii]